MMSNTSSIKNELKFKYKILLSVFIAIFSFGCTGIESNNGYMPVLEDIESLNVKKTSAEKAISILGDPALIMGKESPVFVYFSQSTKKLLFFEPEITSRNLLVLRFDQNKKLNKLEKFSLSDGKNFDLSNNNTTLDIREQSMIGSLFSNLGISNNVVPID